MAPAKVVHDEKIEILKGIFEGRITVLEVEKSIKFPEGIKVRCILLNVIERTPVLLLDNHEPHGYHMHTRLPQDKSHRIKIKVKDFEEAILLFYAEAQKLVKNEI